MERQRGPSGPSTITATLPAMRILEFEANQRDDAGSGKEGYDVSAVCESPPGHGYNVQWRNLNASDFGAPTHRRRFILDLLAAMESRSYGRSQHTGIRPASTQLRCLLSSSLVRTAAECIDWSIPCPSIFERHRPLKKQPCDVSLWDQAVCPGGGESIHCADHPQRRSPRELDGRTVCRR